MKNDNEEVDLNIDDFGSSEYRNNYDVADNGAESEFDMTTQMPTQALPTDRNSGRIRRSKAKFSDDLDLV